MNTPPSAISPEKPTKKFDSVVAPTLASSFSRGPLATGLGAGAGLADATGATFGLVPGCAATVLATPRLAAEC